MLKGLLGFVWRKAPKVFRRWSVDFTQPRFHVTAGAVITNAEGRVLLLKHVFRPGSGWGIPGGFLEKGEQPDDAVRRELREETGMELEAVEIAFIRALKNGRVEVIYRCRARGQEAAPQGYEIKSAEWFPPDDLPAGLSQDQRLIIRRALNHDIRTATGDENSFQ
jgi:8-oxo-dGTP diphosphatase